MSRSLTLSLLCFAFGGACFDPQSHSLPEASLLFLDYYPLYSRFVFSASTVDTDLFAFRIDAASGTLVSTSSIDLGMAPIWVASNPAYRAVYVTRNEFQGGIQTYTYDDNGQLSFADTRLLGAGISNSHRVFVTSDGATIYFNRVQAATDFYRSPVNSSGTPSGHSLALATPFAANSQSAAISPRGDLIVSASWLNSGIRRLTIGSDGNLSDMGDFSLPGNVTIGPAHFTPDGQWLITTADTGAKIFVLRVESGGGLTLVTDLAPGFVVSHGIVEPRGRYYYATSGSNKIVSYRLGGDGSLTPIAELPISEDHQNACFEAGGRFLFMTDFSDTAGEEQLQAFRVEYGGSLSFAGAAAAGNAGRGCAASVDR